MSNSASSPESIALSSYFSVLRRGKWVVAAGLALGLVVAAAVLVLVPQKVTTTVVVNLNVITTDPFNQQRPASGLLDAQTEADIANSHVVAKDAAGRLGHGMTAADVRAASNAYAPGGATIMRVAYTAPTLKESIAGADAVAQSYLHARSAQAEERISTMLAALNKRIDTINAELLDANLVLIKSAPTSTEFAQATSQVQQAQAELSGLLSQRNALTTVDTTGGIVLTPAQDSTPEVSPGRLITLATGAALGLVLGIIGAYVWNAKDRRTRSQKEIAEALNAPHLASFADPDGGALDERADSEQAAIVRERLLGSGVSLDRALIYDARKMREPSLLCTALAAHSPDAPGPSGEHASRSDATAQEPRVVVSDAPQASVLRAVREAEALVVVATLGRTAGEDLEWIRQEAAAAGTPLIGFVLEPRAASRA